jgi:hypothetical protein
MVRVKVDEAVPPPSPLHHYLNLHPYTVTSTATPTPKSAQGGRLLLLYIQVGSQAAVIFVNSFVLSNMSHKPAICKRKECHVVFNPVCCSAATIAFEVNNFFF